MKWITCEETSKLIGITPRAIRKSKDKYLYRYISGKGRGGKVLQIALESLPQEAQDRYNNTIPEEEKLVTDEFYSYTGEQRKLADKKAEAVCEFQNTGLSAEAFVKLHNEQKSFKITANQLYDWQKRFKKGGFAALVDKRGLHNKGEDTIPDNAWNYFNSLYMTQAQRSAAWCWRETSKVFGNIPSYSAFYRRVSTIPKQAIALYRVGNEAFKATLPYYERDPSTLESNEIWFSDHTPLDLLVNVDGKLCRPNFTSWMDAHSRKILSFVLRAQHPNSDIVKKTLGNGIKEHGIPHEVYVDNGKDYRAKDSMSMNYEYSMVRRLGINTIFATPYHGQAKTIERFHRTLEDQFTRGFATYIGNKPQNRPERTRISNEKLLKIAPTLDEVIEKLTYYINEVYNKAEHTGKGMEKSSPDTVYYRDLKRIRKLSDDVSLNVVCGRVKELTVQRNGISMFGTSYYNQELVLNYLKQKVRVYYSPENIDEIYIFTLDDEAICKARATMKSIFRNRTAEDYRERARELKAAKKAVRQFSPISDLTVNQLIVQKHAIEKRAKEVAEIDKSHIEEIEVSLPLMNECKKLKAFEDGKQSRDETVMEVIDTMLNGMG